MPIFPHPNAYEWHDGHTDHHRSAEPFALVPGLRKDTPAQHPHMDTPPKPVNDQAAGVGVATYHKFATPYGHMTPGKPSNLLHYRYENKLPDIENLVKQHGYKTYYAGGKYGKPDLATKNYNTGHLMVYDPTPSSGANFGEETYTKGWRQIHELSHALTYPELNKVYGEGRRIGKLGTHRTLNEAARAVHWEWLAAHKQRELSEKIGVHVSDQDFNRELNTVMHDAVHRAVTGKFTEPSQEGYNPHPHKVPLSTAMDMLREEASKLGLQGAHHLTTNKSERVIFPEHRSYVVADSKTYTPDEAAAILKKAAQEKIAKFEADLRDLRSRELKKAIVPPHKHTTGTTSSAGIEDVAPGKLNPPGIDKAEGGAARCTCKCGCNQRLEGYAPGDKTCGACADVCKAPDKATSTLFEDPEPKVLHPSDKKKVKKADKDAHSSPQSEPKAPEGMDVKKIHKGEEGDIAHMQAHSAQVRSKAGMPSRPAPGPVPADVTQHPNFKPQSQHPAYLDGYQRHFKMALGETPQWAHKIAHAGGEMAMERASGVHKSEEIGKEELCKGCGKSHAGACMDKSDSMPGDSCSKCDGKGHIWHSGEAGPHSDKKITCTRCKGSGEQPGRKGDGKIKPNQLTDVPAHQIKRYDGAGKQIEKAMLKDAKGKEKDNGIVDGSTLPDDKNAEHVNKPGTTSKTAGSGGHIKKGKTLASLHKGILKSEPPMAKPPSGKAPGTMTPVSKPAAMAKPAGGTPAQPTVKNELEKGDFGMGDSGKVATSAAQAAPIKPKLPKKPAYGAANLAAGKAALSAQGITPKPTLPTKPGLVSPKAAGIAASPTPNPTPSPSLAPKKPGIFGRLMGKK